MLLLGPCICGGRGTYALVSIGLVSFVAVANRTSDVLGLFWRGAGLRARPRGSPAVFCLDLHPVPFLAGALGLLPDSFVVDGSFGLAWTRPYALFGLAGLDPITHSLFWSMLVNLGLLIGCSILIPQSPLVRAQAVPFVEALGAHEAERAITWRGSAPLGELAALVGRFLGPSELPGIREAGAKRASIRPS